MKRHSVNTLIICSAVIIALYSNVSMAESPPASIEVTIPDYFVTTTGGLDYVKIPGGEILLDEEGRPRVPYYIASVDYPAGWRVQEVTLEERDGLTTDTGLNLPVVILSDAPESQIEMIGGWYPEEDYSWNIWENADGSTRLDIVVYPFYYNGDTAEVRFYSDYTFSVDCVSSTVAITDLVLDKYEYSPNETVNIDIAFQNNGDVQDIVAGLAINRYGSGETVDGLPLRLLRDVSGDCGLSAAWDTGDTEEGYYYVEATLTDATGNVLDTETVGFGIETVEVLEEEEAEFPTGYVIIAVVLALVLLITLLMTARRRRSV